MQAAGHGPGLPGDGAGGDDFLFGEKDRDTLVGGAGRDHLNGGSDGIADYLEGGSDEDTFVRDARSRTNVDAAKDYRGGFGGDRYVSRGFFDPVELAAHIVLAKYRK